MGSVYGKLVTREVIGEHELLLVDRRNGTLVPSDVRYQILFKRPSGVVTEHGSFATKNEAGEVYWPYVLHLLGEVSSKESRSAR